MLRTALISVSSSASVRVAPGSCVLPSLTFCIFFHVQVQKIMRFQKTPLGFDVNVYTPLNGLSVDAAQRNRRSVCCVAPRPHRSKKSSVEIYVWATMC